MRQLTPSLMKLLPITLLGLCLGLSACGADERSNTDTNNRWQLTDMSAKQDMNQRQDMARPQDIGGDLDVRQDMAVADMSVTDDMAQDMAPVDDMAPDMSIDDPLTRDLVRAPWLGILELESQGSQSVGLALELTFSADKTVKVSVNQTRVGKWQELDNGRIFIYDLPKDDGTGNEELFFEPVRVQGQLRALSLTISVNPQRTLPFEQVSARSARDFTRSELTGRWQSINRHTNRNNDTFHIALRIDAAGRMEYGVLGRDEIFRGFLDYPINTATFSDQRSFWHVIPPTNSMMTPPLAGQLLRAVDGSVRLFAPIGEKDDRGEDIFFTYELRKVTDFSWRN